jgi:hypothetical protein
MDSKSSSAKAQR